jgi:flagellar biosynthetic protein FlhB
MPEKPASERTEPPTRERLKKAREQGRVAQSREVPTAMMIAALVGVLALTAGRLYRWFVTQMQEGLSAGPPTAAGQQAFLGLLEARGQQCLWVLAPFLIVAAVVSVFGSLLVGGWAVSPKAVRFDLSRISPVRGLKNLVSMRAVVQLLVAIAKLAVILLVAWGYLSDRMAAVLSLSWASPAGLLVGVSGLVFGLAIRIAMAMGVIAAADMLYQRYNHRRQLRMTRQEVKEERKQHELSPEVRSHLRAVQLAATRRRMLQEVPEADVVVTNPTHYAVALRYEAASMDAPRVVAKGADVLCEKIKEIARAHAVPIVERPELARALYDTVACGQAVPEALFVAVAELLVTIYRLRRQRGGAGTPG